MRTDSRGHGSSRGFFFSIEHMATRLGVRYGIAKLPDSHDLPAVRNDASR